MKKGKRKYKHNLFIPKLNHINFDKIPELCSKEVEFSYKNIIFFTKIIFKNQLKSVG